MIGQHFYTLPEQTEIAQDLILSVLFVLKYGTLNSSLLQQLQAKKEQSDSGIGSLLAGSLIHTQPDSIPL